MSRIRVKTSRCSSTDFQYGIEFLRMEYSQCWLMYERWEKDSSAESVVAPNAKNNDYYYYAHTEACYFIV